jgi:hypothetical protein
MRERLKGIRNAKNEPEMIQNWDDFTNVFKKHKKMINYLKTWMTQERVAKWALFLRKVGLLTMWN